MIKVHFRTLRAALTHSHDGSAWAGMRYPSGRIKTWVAYVKKAHRAETSDDAACRLSTREVK